MNNPQAIADIIGFVFDDQLRVNGQHAGNNVIVPQTTRLVIKCPVDWPGKCRLEVSKGSFAD